MDEWYRVGIVFNPDRTVRWLKDERTRKVRTWTTTKYKYTCRLFSFGVAEMHKKALQFMLDKHGLSGQVIMEGCND